MNTLFIALIMYNIGSSNTAISTVSHLNQNQCAELKARIESKNTKWVGNWAVDCIKLTKEEGD